MSRPSSDPAPPAGGEPADPTQRLAELTAAIALLQAENADLRTRLQLSEAARTDLVAQFDHVLELLGDSRRQLRACWAKDAPPPPST